ncbi:MAG: Bax inhibitor-1 family protein, partial [Neisseriaceae bacterium]|nr:Bax inhibitor-1 family protein [Neisseriaceae bacterium]
MSNQNMTDYTQIGQSVSAQEVILSKTYRLLALSFLPCAAGAVAGMFFNPFIALFATNFWVGVIAFFAFFYGMCFLIEKNRYSNVGVALLMVFTFGMGLMLTPVLALVMAGGSGAKLVAVAAAMTAAIFFAMAAMARRANINTMALGNFLAIGAIVLMIGVVANLFLQLSVLSLALAGLFVIFSS